MDAATTHDLGAREGLPQGLEHMVDDSGQLLVANGRGGGELFHTARQKLEQQLRRAKADLRRMEIGAIDNARRAARATDQAVHDHPYGAMGMAATAGLLIGMLITRR